MQYDSLDEYNEQLDQQLSDMMKFIGEQETALAESAEASEGQLLEYRYVRQPNGDIVVMSKPYDKLTARELQDTENNLTTEPFDDKDPDVRIRRIAAAGQLPRFHVDTGLDKRKRMTHAHLVDNMDIGDKKPRPREDETGEPLPSQPPAPTPTPAPAEDLNKKMQQE